MGARRQPARDTCEVALPEKARLQRSREVGRAGRGARQQQHAGGVPIKPVQNVHATVRRLALRSEGELGALGLKNLDDRVAMEAAGVMHLRGVRQ